MNPTFGRVARHVAGEDKLILHSYYYHQQPQQDRDTGRQVFHLECKGREGREGRRGRGQHHLIYWEQVEEEQQEEEEEEEEGGR